VAEALAYVQPRCPAAIHALVEMLGDRDSAVRVQAASALGRLGLEAQTAIPALTEALHSPEANLRTDAAIALAQVGGNAQAVLPLLLEVAQERGHQNRIRAMEALSRLGVTSEPVIAALIRALQDEVTAQVKAAELLGRMGVAAKAAIPALRDVLKGSDPETSVQAALALWKIDRRADEALPVLVAELKMPIAPRPASSLLPTPRFGGTSNVPAAPPCQQAAEALGEMGPAARAAVPALTEAVKDPRLAAYRPYFEAALKKIGG
jgi:HEAT repeat protein